MTDQIEGIKQIKEEFGGNFCSFEPEWITNSLWASSERHKREVAQQKNPHGLNAGVTSDGKVRKNMEMKVSEGGGSIKWERPEERSEGGLK